MEYRGKYGCSGCNMSDCYVCRNLNKCPNCGQGDYPIGKHNKCTVCEFQIDEVTYDKDEHDRYPSFHWDDSDFKNGGKVF